VGKPLKKTHTWSGGTGVRTRDLPNVKWRARRLATVLDAEGGFQEVHEDGTGDSCGVVVVRAPSAVDNWQLFDNSIL
jgi:hypothetical protein